MSASASSCGHDVAQTLIALCRYCCKSPQLLGANFPVVKKSDRRPLIRVPSIALSRSSASLSSDDEVPHIFRRKSRLKPGKFLITSAKRLLQQNLPKAAESRCSKTVADLHSRSISHALSLHLQIEALDQRRPFSLFGVNLSGIFRRRARHWLGAFVQHLLSHLLGHHRSTQFARQPSTMAAGVPAGATRP